MGIGTAGAARDTAQAASGRAAVFIIAQYAHRKRIMRIARYPAPLTVLKWAVLMALAWVSAMPCRADAPAPVVRAPQVEHPKRVLFIGNSYLYYGDSLHNHVQRMVGASGLAPLGTLEFKSSTIGGAALEHHPVQWLLSHGRIGVMQPFELVILQGGSGEPLSARRASRFREVLADHQQQIRARGAQVALYMTHAYGTSHRQYKPENIRLTETMYVEAGNEIGALVIPVGLAFEESGLRHPELALHKSDGTHPSLLGTYLAASTVFAAVYGRSAVGNPYTYGGAIDSDTATKLQRVAQDTVDRFYRR